MSPKNTLEVSEELLATGEQIEHIMDMWRRRLRDRKLTRDEANHIIQHGGQYLEVMDKAADVLVDQVRSMRTNTIVRIVRNIRRDRTAREAIDAIDWTKYINDTVVGTIPMVAGPEEVELVYVQTDRNMLSPAEQVEFLASCDLEPDPPAQMADNEQDPAFADEHPNGFQWELSGRAASSAGFGLWAVNA